MDQEWKRLYEEALSVLNPHDVSNKMWVGSVASAVLTKKEIYIKGYVSIRMVLSECALKEMLYQQCSHMVKVRLQKWSPYIKTATSSHPVVYAENL